MAETKNKDFRIKNQALYERMAKDPPGEARKQTADELITNNHGLIAMAVDASGWRQYTLTEYEDVKQTAMMLFLSIINRHIDNNEKEYPSIIYPELLRALQEALSTFYSNSGVSIPYSTKKLLQRQDYEEAKTIGRSVSYTNDSAEPSLLNHLEYLISKEYNNMSMEDRICTMIVIKDFLKKQTEEKRKIFAYRFIHNLTFREIGEITNQPEDRVRYILNCLTEEIRKELED